MNMTAEFLLGLLISTDLTEAALGGEFWRPQRNGAVCSGWRSKIGSVTTSLHGLCSMSWDMCRESTGVVENLVNVLVGLVINAFFHILQLRPKPLQVLRYHMKTPVSLVVAQLQICWPFCSCQCEKLTVFASSMRCSKGQECGPSCSYSSYWAGERA
eukprot:s3425_g7.t1